MKIINGDSVYYTLNIREKKNGVESDYVFPEKYKLVVTVRTLTPEAKVVFNKTIENSNVVQFRSDDTEQIGIGDYKFIVKLLLPNGDKYTVIRDFLSVEGGE